MNDTKHQPMKRKLLALLCGLPWLGACRAGPDPYHTGDPAEDALRQRFRGIGIQLVLDAVAGVEMDDVEIINDQGVIIQNPTTVALRKRSISDVGSARVPRWVRVTWREGGGWSDIPIGDPRRNAYRSERTPPRVKLLKGDIAGDYTVPVAERIPDSVLDYIRKNGGALRLKIRLADDGILIGWDVERRIPQPNCVKTPGDTCFQHEYFMTGGDFKEYRLAHSTGDSTFPYPITLPMSEENKAFLEKHGLERWYNGDIWEKGWYIDKNGRKVLTDY